MPNSYDNQLNEIRDMLIDSAPEVVQEAWAMLFKLWLENIDSSDFDRDLIPIALTHRNLTIEFEKRFDELVARNTVTDIYLRQKLIYLALKIKQSKDSDTRKISTKTKKIFVSYSHKDEAYKDELVTILTPLQDEGVFEIWQDREITPGDEWYQAIQEAMNTCELALLLISGDFLTSRFIRDEELVRLFERRKKEGLRVVPIIIRPCLWQSKSVLKGIQALPRDGKPVSGSADRDQIWTEIGMAIENLAK